MIDAAAFLMWGGLVAYGFWRWWYRPYPKRKR